MGRKRPSLVADPEALAGDFPRPLGREQQLKEIRACFTGELASARPLHVWAFGPSGAGKTFIVRYLLNKEAQAAGALPLYVPCAERFTFLNCIDHLLDTVAPLRSPQRTREKQLSILRETLADRRVLIALDEIDILPRDDQADLLLHLTGLPHASLICIAQSREALLALPEAIRSRLAPRQVLFARYQPAETSRILEAAAARTLVPGTWRKESLQEVVERSYGDARRGLALLRHMVQRAEEAGSSRLLPGHLVRGNFDHFSHQAEELLASLSSHHRILYDLVCGKGPVRSSLLEQAYQRACSRKGLEPVSPRSLSNYLAQLCQRRILRRERGAGRGEWVYSPVADPATSP